MHSTYLFFNSKIILNVFLYYLKKKKYKWILNVNNLFLPVCIHVSELLFGFVSSAIRQKREEHKDGDSEKKEKKKLESKCCTLSINTWMHTKVVVYPFIFNV